MTDLTIRSRSLVAARHAAPGCNHLGRRLIGVGVLLAVAVVGAYAATRSDEFDYRFATARTENATGGYAFSYPPSWDLTRSGSATKLVAPDDNVVVTLGTGPRGGVESAANALVVQIQRSYGDVRVLGSQPQMIGSARALAISGTGKNDAGVGLRFLAIAVQGPGGRTLAVTAFTLMDANPRLVVPVLNEIVSSLRSA